MPLVADSAAAVGARHQGRPVATQAAAHAYSLSFAKVVSAGGSGGALALPADAVEAAAGDRSTGCGRCRWSRPRRWPRSICSRTSTCCSTGGGRSPPVTPSSRPWRGCGRSRWPTATRTRSCTGWRDSAGSTGDRLAAELDRLGVRTKPYYAPPLHWHDWGPYAERAGPLPVSDALGREALALPMSSELSPLQAERVTMAVLAALTAARR